MKKLIMVAVLLAGVAAQNLEAAPYYRLWRGYKLPEASGVETSESRNKFLDSIAKTFIPATVEMGAGLSLKSYHPAIPNKKNVNILLPDEIALIEYESKEKYDALRSTLIGTAYGNLHWQYFVKAPTDPAAPIPANTSKSSVPEVLTENFTLENGKSYDFLQGTPDWQAGIVKVRFLKRKSDPTAELELVKKIKSDYAQKSQAYILLVDANYFMTYELWPDEATLKNSQFEEFLDANFEVLGKNTITEKKTEKNLSGLQALTIKDGQALNVQFDSETPAAYVEQAKAGEYFANRLTEIQGSYATYKDTKLNKNNDKDGNVNRVYQIKYDDELGIPVVHSDYLQFKFEKTVLSPEGKLLVISDGETIF